MWIRGLGFIGLGFLDLGFSVWGLGLLLGVPIYSTLSMVLASMYGRSGYVYQGHISVNCIVKSYFDTCGNVILWAS